MQVDGLKVHRDLESEFTRMQAWGWRIRAKQGDARGWMCYPPDDSVSPVAITDKRERGNSASNIRGQLRRAGLPDHMPPLKHPLPAAIPRSLPDAPVPTPADVAALAHRDDPDAANPETPAVTLEQRIGACIADASDSLTGALLKAQRHWSSGVADAIDELTRQLYAAIREQVTADNTELLEVAEQEVEELRESLRAREQMLEARDEQIRRLIERAEAAEGWKRQFQSLMKD